MGNYNPEENKIILPLSSFNVKPL